jgi:hypothetical protein
MRIGFVRHEFIGELLQLADNALQSRDLIKRMCALGISYLFSDDVDHGLNEVPDRRVLTD